MNFIIIDIGPIQVKVSIEGSLLTLEAKDRERVFTMIDEIRAAIEKAKTQ